MGGLRRRMVSVLLVVAVVPLLLGSVGPRTQFDERLLAAHNRERVAMAVAPLQWDPKLATSAGIWAAHLSRTGRFEHSPDEPRGEPIGENIWGGTPGAYLPENMIQLWIAEKAHFRSGTFPHTSRTGRVEDVSHYTQLVWRGTTHVGCAVTTSASEEVLVCHYRTAGNIIGQSVT